MIKVSIKHHNPIIIYEFLEEHAGPVKRMMVKQGHAIISFKEEKDYKLALERFEYFSLCGKGVRLEPYSQEKKNESEIVNKPNERGKEVVRNEIEKGISDIMVKMEGNDTLYNIEKIVRKHKNNMAQQMTIVDNFMKEAQQKVKNYVQSFGENSQKIKKIEKHLQKRLKTIFKTLKTGYNFLKNEIKTFDQTQINLDPEFQCPKIQQRPLEITSFKQHLQYQNSEPSGCIKRLIPFNKSQFIFSEMSRKNQNFQGRLKIYDIEQQTKKTSITCKEGAYGLLSVDKYIITGTFCGYFSYYNQDRTDFQELTPRLFGTYGTPQKITDILFGGERYKGYNILALGQRKTVKSFYVQQSEMYPKIKSLIFSERATICEKNGKQIGTIQMLQSTQELLMASSNILSVYDLNNQTYSNQINTNFDILRIKKFDNRLTYLAQRKRISSVDIRSSQTKRFTFKADVSALCVLNEHSVIYGTERGQIGLFDVRKQNIVFADALGHKDWISDIIKINDTIISGDRGGHIVSWKGCDSK